MNFLIKYQSMLVVSGLILCGLIALLQEYRVNLRWVTSYGADFFAPTIIYYFIRRTNRIVIKLPFRPSKVQVAVVLLGLCVLWELRQYYDPVYGTFDVVDLVVYCGAIFLCFLVDSNLERHSLRDKTTWN